MYETQHEYWTRIIFNEIQYSCSIKETTNPILLKEIILESILAQYTYLQDEFQKSSFEAIDEKWFYLHYNDIMNMNFNEFNIIITNECKYSPITQIKDDYISTYELLNFIIHPVDKNWCKFIFNLTIKEK